MALAMSIYVTYDVYLWHLRCLSMAFAMSIYVICDVYLWHLRCLFMALVILTGLTLRQMTLVTLLSYTI